MEADFIFVHHRILRSCMAFRALPGGAYQVCARLLRFNTGPGPVDEKCCQNQRKGNYDGDKDGPKRHLKPPGERREMLEFPVEDAILVEHR